MIGAIIVVIGLTTGCYPLNIEVGFWFGALLVFLGLAQQLIDLDSGWVRFLLNIVFLIGVYLMYESFMVKDLNVLVSIYFLAMTFFRIFTLRARGR